MAFSFATALIISFIAATPYAAGDDAVKKILSDSDAPWEITADSLTYKSEDGVFLAEGDVVISQKDQVLYAQKAFYNERTGMAKVSGDVRLEAAGDVLEGEKGVFDLKKRTGRIDKGRIFLVKNHFYINADVMEKMGEASYLLKNCTVTTCDGENPEWSISGSEVKVTIEGYGTVKNAAFNVMGIPLIYVPYAIFPAKTKRQTGLLIPSVAYGSRRGAEVDIPFFWSISDQVDATFYQHYMSKRGYMQGLELRYLADENSRGELLFDILSDRKEKKNLNESDEAALSPFERTNRTRYWLRGKLDQDMPFGIDARVDADYVSDQDYLREFGQEAGGMSVRPDITRNFGRYVDDRYSPTRVSTLRLSKDWESISVQAASTYNQRPEDIPLDGTAQPLGALNLDLLPVMPAGLPIFFGLESDYGYIWRDSGEKGDRLFLSPEMRIPLRFGRYMEFESSFKYSYVEQWIDKSPVQEDRQSKKAYETGASLSASFDRIYETNWKRATRLKHRIRPVLSYGYRIPQDQNEYQPWFEPIEVEDKINAVSFAIENFLDARLEDEKGNVSYRQWARLSLSQAYSLDETRRDEDPWREKEPFEPLTAEIAVKPTPELDLLGSAGWNHYAHEFTQADLSVGLALPGRGAGLHTFELDYTYEKDEEESLSLALGLDLGRGFSVGTSLSREMDDSEDISRTYWTGYDSQCWGARFIAETSDEDTSLMVVIKLTGLGDIGF